MADIGKITPREITEEMKESYIDYAMSVIVARALPDVRDGLKPVHRRILYAMNELGLRAGAKHVKSARVVGECFIKDTLVATNRGLIPIQDIVVGDFVFTQEGLRLVEALYIMPPRRLLRITLSNGISATVTHSQKLKVFTADGSFAWKEAKHLEFGDWLAIRSVYPELEEVRLSDYNKHRKTLNKNIAYILGLLISDGWITADYGLSHRRRLGFCASEKSIMDKLVRCFENEFGYTPTIEIKRYTIKQADGGFLQKELYSLRINRAEINAYFINEFNIPNEYKAPTKSIPRKIFSSPKEVIFSFISGLVDGDGSVAKRGRSTIVYASVSKKLIDQLQILLQYLGIFGHRYSQQNRQARGVVNGRLISSRHTGYTLEIHGAEAQKLARVLSLASTAKARRLEIILAADPKRLWSDFGVFPYGGRLIFSELSKNHLGGGWYYSPSEEKKFRMGIHYQGGSKLRYSSDLLEKPLRIRQIADFGIADKLVRLNSPFADLVRSATEKGVSFLRMEHKEEALPEKTYDIRVADDHEFIANGIISHNCLGKYHPHGDIAVYDALVRMAQDFSLRYPLVDGQGNFGSIDADAAAAQRYTEVRMTRIADEMLRDIDKETVDFADNYDATRKEPTVLPAAVPNLLLNGSLGIAVGMATNIPPHNLGELSDALVYLIEHPDASVDELMVFVKGPDFPTGGVIFNEKEINQAYAMGRGAILIRGKAEITEKKGGEGRPGKQIIITEIPYQVNKAELIAKIAELAKDKKIEGIKDIRDESDKEGLRIAIDLKAEAFPQKVLNGLYKFTDLEKNFNLNMLALVDGIQPQILSLKAALEEYVKHRQAIVRRRSEYDLTKARERAHILEGLKKALDQIDAVIKTIKKSRDKEDAHKNLTARFKFTAVQAAAILEMKLQALAALEKQKIEDELKEKLSLIRDLEALLKDNRKILGVVKKELADVKAKYGDERRTKVVRGAALEIAEEDIIPEEETIVVLTRGGYIKRVKPESYRVQKRGGKGVVGMETKEEDVVQHFLTANTHSDLLFFTDLGKVYQIKAYEIPEASRISRGKAVHNFISIGGNETVQSILGAPKRGKGEKHEGYLVMATKNGMIKKVAGSSFGEVRRSGLVAIRLKKGDQLRWVKITKGRDDIVIVTKRAQSIRFSEKDVRPMGRAAAGVRAIRLRKDDEVIGFDVIPEGGAGKEMQMLVVTEQGYGKRTPVKEYKRQRRGGSGVKTAKLTAKNGVVVSMRALLGETDLIAISRKGQVIRTQIQQIAVLSRSTQGVRVMKLAAGDGVASVTVL